MTYLNSNDRSCGSKATYKAFWSDITAFDALLVASGMIGDHFPDAICDSLLHLLDQYPQSIDIEIKI